MKVNPYLGRWYTDASLVVLCLMGAGAYSLYRRQDVNWDLKNYHFYNAFAYLNDRLNFDVAPAGVLTFFNPILDLPFFFYISWFNDTPRAVAMLMALPSGVAVFFLFKLLLEVFESERRDRAALILVSLGFGVSGAAGIALWGTTMNEWPVAALDMVALYVLVRAVKDTQISISALMTSGLICGIAAGLKLTAATYCVAMFGAILCLDRRLLVNSKAALCFGIAVVFGLAVSMGPWMLTLYENFENPLFPLFNDVFRSPWWEPKRMAFDHWVPKTWQDAALFPFMMFKKNHIASEVAFRDWHLPFLYIAGILAIGRVLAAGLRRPAGVSPIHAGRLERFLISYLLISYVIWLGLHGNYRYLIQIELISGCLLAIILSNVVSRKILKPLLVALLVVLWMTKLNPSWGRTEFGPRYFDIRVPEIPGDSLVILPSSEPLSYLVPFFQQSVRFMTVNTSLIRPGMNSLLSRRAEDLIKRQRGSIYVIDIPKRIHAGVLKEYGLEIDVEGCKLIESNLDRNGVSICKALRIEG